MRYVTYRACVNTIKICFYLYLLTCVWPPYGYSWCISFEFHMRIDAFKCICNINNFLYKTWDYRTHNVQSTRKIIYLYCKFIHRKYRMTKKQNKILQSRATIYNTVSVFISFVTIKALLLYNVKKTNYNDSKWKTYAIFTIYMHVMKCGIGLIWQKNSFRLDA